MKFITLILLLTFQTILFDMNAQEKKYTLESLQWEFSAANDPIKFSAHIPGNVFLDLEKNGLIQNPLLGLGEEKAQWVSHQDWEYSAQHIICPPHQKNERVFLHLPELDTYCDIYWNNKLLTRADNAFIHWKIDITDLILPTMKSRSFFILLIK